MPRPPLFMRAAVGVALLVLHPAPAWPASQSGRTSAKLAIPFTATVRDPTNTEDVNVTGHLIVSTIMILTSRPFKITAIARLGSDVTAIGASSDVHYVTTGKSHLIYYWPFTPTDIRNTIPLRLYPPATSLPTPPLRLWLLQYHVGYAPDGQVTSMDATMVPDPASGSCSTLVEVCE